MQSQDSSYTTEGIVARCRVILTELLQEREQLLRDQQSNRLSSSGKNNQHTTLMLKAIDKAILDVASYIDEHSA
ncbi:MAG: hypothetical protein U0350_10510 [Caldilineaceae bacterium]